MFEPSQEQDLQSFGVDKKFTQASYLQRNISAPPISDHVHVAFDAILKFALTFNYIFILQSYRVQTICCLLNLTMR